MPVGPKLSIWEVAFSIRQQAMSLGSPWTQTKVTNISMSEACGGDLHLYSQYIGKVGLAGK